MVCAETGGESERSRYFWRNHLNQNRKREEKEEEEKNK